MGLALLLLLAAWLSIFLGLNGLATGLSLVVLNLAAFIFLKTFNEEADDESDEL